MRTRRGVLVAGAGAVGVAVLCVPALTGQADEDAESPPAASTAAEPGPGWALALREDFEDVDTTYWTLQDHTYNANEDSYLKAANCSIEDAGGDESVLRLQGKREAVRRWGEEWKYTSCYVTTEGKYSVPNYFRAEVRAKVPMEQGMWAAPLWFRPWDGSGGEIDLVETLGGSPRPRVSQTIHTDYGRGHDQSSYATPFARLGDPTGTRWHTYTIEKMPGRITMWVDGTQTAEWSVRDPSWYAEYYETAKRWDLRINLQIGGDWGGPPDASTDWSPDRTAMLVDYVYVWKPVALSMFEGAP